MPNHFCTPIIPFKSQTTRKTYGNQRLLKQKKSNTENSNRNTCDTLQCHHTVSTSEWVYGLAYCQTHNGSFRWRFLALLTVAAKISRHCNKTETKSKEIKREHLLARGVNSETRDMWLKIAFWKHSYVQSSTSSSNMDWEKAYDKFRATQQTQDWLWQAWSVCRRQKSSHGRM